MKVPAAHSVQSGAGWPPGLYDPALHKLHSDAVLAPELGLCVPAGQAVELLEPAGQKQPRAQSWQAAAVDDPFWGLYVPALQRVHELQPLTFANVPTAQGAHTDTPDVGLLEPGLQGLHAARARASPYVPAAHGRQAVDELAPKELLYVPKPHTMQDDEETEPV